jgi:ubiquitin-conjugating enzyme E2 S
MMTRIFHPNVSKAGEICVDTLKKGWNKKYGVGHVLVVRISFPYHPLASHQLETLDCLPRSDRYLGHGEAVLMDRR